MATDQSYARLYNKKLMPLDQFDTNFLQYLRALTDDSIIIATDGRGAAIKTQVTVVATGNNQVNVGPAGGPYKAINGLGKVIKFNAADSRLQSVKIPPDAAVTYGVALETALVEDKTEVNPRTGVVEYRNIKEEIGRVLSPSAVTWTPGTSTLSLTLNNHFETTKDNSARQIRVWLKPLASGGLVGPQVAVDGPGVAAAFYEANATFDGTNTVLNIVSSTPLGQSSTPSTVAADYLVLVKGPTVRRNALENLINTSGACFLALVTSVANANPITTIVLTSQQVITYGVFTAAPGSNGAGVTGTGDGTGPGVLGTGGTTSGAGGSFTGGTPNGNGVTSQGTGTGKGVQGTGGATGVGVAGVGGATSGDGVTGTGSAGNSRGVFGQGQGSAAGVGGTGGATGAGGSFTGGATSGAGIVGTGGTSGDGVQGTGTSGNRGGTFAGQGAGAGAQGTGGTTGAGVVGIGGATSGDGITGTGTAGNSRGGTFAGQGSAAGAQGTGGATGAGLVGVGGATSGAGVTGTGTAGNSLGVSGQGQGSAGGVQGTGGATGAGVVGVGGATSGTGVTGTGTNGNAVGVSGQGQGSGSGTTGTGGATGNGVTGTGGATSGDGVAGTGTGGGRGGTFAGQGAGAGAQGTGGTTGVGLVGVGGATSGAGVTGTGTAGNSRGGGFTGQGTAEGVLGTGGATGPGVIATAGGGASPVRGAIGLTPTTNAPSTSVAGDLWVTSAGVLGVNLNSVVKTILTSPIARGDLPAVGQQVSSSTGSFSTSSTTFVDVTNATISITTTGRPVFLALQSDAAGSEAYLSAIAGAANPIAYFKLLRGATEIAQVDVHPIANGSTSIAVEVPPPFLCIDVVGAGTYTYKVQAKVDLGTSTAAVRNCKLVAYEL